MSPRTMHISIAGTLAALLALAAAGGGLMAPPRLQQVRDAGTLTAAMDVGPASYTPGENGTPGGYEYELLSRFARDLGVRLEIRVVSTVDEAAALLENGSVDIVAATVSPTRERRERFIFTDSYLQTQPRVIYRQGDTRPREAADLVGKRIEAVAHSVHAKRLAALGREHNGIDWRLREGQTSDDLLYRVWRKHSDYAITDELRLALNRPFYPELRAGMKVGSERALAWMLRRGDDDLRDAANRYLERLRADGMLALLRDEHFGHLQEFDYVGTRTFLRHITERLPTLRDTFVSAAAEQGLDWRLLAAIGYQESHWDADAVSPTGVRGIMMLTQDTARFVGIDDRTKPTQSIQGGAKYFLYLHERLPPDIQPPNRIWFTLAAYNVGLGHLNDARRITEMRDGDPDRWVDVRENLPLLAEPEWYERVRHGYARGREPVRYVANIRRYYELLQRVTGMGQPATPAPEHEALMPQSLNIPDSLESVL